MSDTTLTHRIPKESLVIKAKISFREAIRKVNELTDEGMNIKNSCEKVFAQYTIINGRGIKPFERAEKFRIAMYWKSSRLRRISRKHRKEKKETKSFLPAVKDTQVPKNTDDNNFRAFYLSIKGIIEMPLSATKKIEVIRAIL